MKKQLLFLVAVFIATLSYGQISGTKSIPGDYATIAAAIADINTNGIGAGGVTFNVTAGHTETLSSTSAGTITTLTSSASNPIVFQRSGSGANPKITAFALTAATTYDGMIKFAGCDYVTFDGIDLQENLANATNRTDWGYAILVESASDASQNIVIKNCVVTLNKVNTASVGIYSKNHTATSTTLVTPTKGIAVVSNCAVDNCTIDAYVGISWTGYAATSTTLDLYGQDNRIGYTAGNTISAFGGSSTSAYGIYAVYQNNMIIANNSVNGGTGNTTTTYGVYSGTGTNSNVDIYSNSINLTPTATTSTIYGLYNTTGGTGTNNTVNVYNNAVSINYATATTGAIYPFYHSASALNYNLYGNFISNCVQGSASTTGTGSFYGFYVTGSTTTAGSAWQIYNNTINGNSRVQSVFGAGSSYGMYIIASGLSLSVYNNNVYNNSWPSTSAVYGIYASASAPTTMTVHDNQVYDISKPNAVNNSGTRSGSIYGINISNTATNNVTTLENNTVYNLSNTWGGQVMPFQANGGTTGTVNINSNTAYNITANDNAIFGIYNTSGLTVNIFKNRLYNMSAAIGDSASFYGICTGTSTVAAVTSVYNNFISDLRAPEAAVFLSSGLYLFGSTAGTNYKYYYNTVYLNQTATAGSPSTSAVFTNTVPNLDMRNNILVNNSTSFGGGATIAFWRSSATGTTYSANSNFNCFHAGTPGANNVIFYDFATADQTLAAYQSRFPQEAQSFTQVPPFINIAATPYDLHLNTGISTPCESGGTVIVTPAIVSDYDTEARFPNAGYPNNANPAFAASAPDVGADEFGGIPYFTCVQPNPGNTVASANGICLGASVTLTCQNPTPGTGVAFQWESSSDGTNWSPVLNANASSYTFTPDASLYFHCVVTCQNGPTSGTSNSLLISFANSVTSVTPNTRCGTGTVILEAATSTGTLNWYAAAAGGASLGTGSPFTTPIISATTNYYVASETAVPGSPVVGAGATTSATYSNPFYSLYSNLHNQHLIKATELAAAGLLAGDITALGINITSIGTLPMIDFSMKIGQTTATDMSAFVSPAFTTVYTNASLMPVAGLNTLTFSTPFTWDGTSNIVIEICHGNSASTATMSRTCLADNTSFISSIHTHVTTSPGTSGADICGNILTNKTTYSVRPQFTFTGTAICSSPRSLVVATVTPAPVLTISAGQTVCSDEVATLSVTSTPLSDYDSYTWSPATNLFTDFACTTPYVALANATTVYVKSAAAFIQNYTCTAYNSATLCGNTAQSEITVLPVSPVITGIPASICVSGAAVLTVAPSTGYGAATFQWQNSADNTNFLDIIGATTLNYTTPTLYSTTYYKLIIKNGAGTICSSPQITMAVNNPLVLTTTEGSRCGIGTVILEATTTAGSTLDWYASLTGASIGTGPSFTTPVISETTTFYVGASAGAGGNYYVGKTGIEPGAGTGGGIGTYMNFTAISDFVLQTVDIFPYGTGAGTVTIALQSSTGTTITSATVNATGTTSTASPAQTVTLGFAVTGGASYRLTATAWTGGVTNLYRDGTNFTYPYTVPGVMSIDGPSTSGWYYFWYNWMVSTGCASARTAVTATVVPGPAVTVTADQTVCSDEAAMITVTSTLGDFTSYTWSPVTNLFTNPACTTPYVALDNATTVYAKTSAGGVTTYTCTASNPPNGCGSVSQSIVTVIPPSPLIVSEPEAICISGSAVLSPSPATGFGTATFQWQDSNDNSHFNDIIGATNMTYTTPTITTTSYYKLIIKNGLGIECTSSQFTLTVNNPQVIATSPATRCGTGTVTLGATGSPGSTLSWYSAPTGGALLGTGSTFTTPVISVTTPYYVGASSGGGSIQSVASPTAGASTFWTASTGWGLRFTVNSAVTITSVKMYPLNTTAGAASIQVKITDLTDVVLYTGPLHNFTVGTTAAEQVVPVNVAVQPGNYKMVMTSTGISGLVRESSGVTFPYNSPGGEVSITAGANGTGSAQTTSAYYWFYAWTISTGCESARETVSAKVNAPPEITPSATPASICAGQAGTLDVTSTNLDYTYTWMPGNLSGAVQTVYPEATTTYTVTASDAVSGCNTSGTATLTVLTSPSPIVITPAAPVILSGAIQQLTATGGVVSGVTIFSEDFNAPTNSWTTINNSTGGTSPALTAWTLRPDAYVYSSFGTWHSNDNSQFYLSNSDAAGSGVTTATILQSPAFSTVGYATANLSFYHYFNWNSLSAKVDYSVDGTTWVNLKTYIADAGAVGAFVQDNIVLPAGALNQANLLIRFKYDGGWDYFWGIDNVLVSGSVQSTMTWAPYTDLYTDNLATILYNGESLTTVYSKPAATITYTASATASGSGCVRNQTVTVTVESQCDVPTSVTSSDVTATTATISWTAPVTPVGFGYEYEVRTSGAAGSGSTGLFVAGSTPVGVTSALITGLNPLTLYNVYVRSNCGNGNFSDWTAGYAFETTLPEYLSVNGDVSTVVCYNATNTITVAGASTTFNVMAPSGSATFIAGVRILFMPGTHVNPGAYMHGYISTTYCSISKSLDGPVAETKPEETQMNLSHTYFNLYPNPTSGNFTLEQKGDKTYGMVKVEIYSMNGKKVMTENIVGEKKHEFNFSYLPVGLYFVKIVADEYVETIKLIKSR